MLPPADHRSARLVILAAFVVAASGCSTVGTWRVTRVEPEGAAFPLELLTLDQQGRFTASGRENTRLRTRTGLYRLHGGELRLVSAGDGEERYASKRLPSGSWRLSIDSRQGRTPVVATLRRVSE